MAKSPNRDEILQDKATLEYGRNLITKLFWAETPEAVTAYVDAGISVNQTNLVEHKTALDYCIDRVIKGINNYEDSDNKGAALALIRRGGNCSSETLERLKKADPLFYGQVRDAFTSRELQEAIKENPSIKINELKEKSREIKLYPRSGHTESREYHLGSIDLDHDPRRDAMIKSMLEKKYQKKKSELAEVNEPKNLTIVSGKHKILHEFDEVEVPTHETQHLKNSRTTAFEGAVFEAARRSAHRALLNVAVTVDNKENGRYLSEDELCRKMVEAAKTNKAAKAEYNGYTFVIGHGTNQQGALYELKEQVLKPWMAEKIEQGMIDSEDVLSMLQRGTGRNYNEISWSSFKEACAVEILLDKYPEHADKITMMQLANALSKAVSIRDKDAYGKLNTALLASTKRFINGEENFPPTLENVVALNQTGDEIIFNAGIAISQSKFDKRVAETELKMLQDLKPEDLRDKSAYMLGAGMAIAEKHKGMDAALKMLYNELMRQNKEHREKSSDPRNPK